MTPSLLRAVRWVQDGVRNQLWPLPTLAIVLAVVLGILVPLLDLRVDQHLPAVLDTVVFNGDPGAARTVLDAVASSLITVTSLTFSLTVVTLQLASSQFSPRLLRTFTQDLFVQVTLGIFLATFTFALTVLRSVRSPDEGGTAFVPRLAVTLAFVLALASVVALVLFLAHLTRQIRVETMLLRVREDAASTLGTNLVRRDASDPTYAVPAPPPSASVLRASGSGFLTAVDQDRLLRAAVEADACVLVGRRPGSFVVEGTVLGRAWSSDDGPLGGEALDRLRQAVARSVRLGAERTGAQDVGYGFRQVTDIVNKALSPGVNDPTTAVHGLGQASALLAAASAYRLGPLVLADDQDRPRVVLDRPTLADLLELVVAQPRAYGASDPQVLARLYGLLADLAVHVDDQDRAAVADQLRRLDATVARQDLDDVESARMAGLGRDVREALAAGPGAAQ
ncbi:DUF2254 domain-containing protein [Microlunatus spumicola]|uniref:DUF2254 domain-containing protein n=1 Tax=Microlunatus spumicola TaxID=81499 RepID=A0ABP6WHE3_9ACTN